MFLPTWEIVHSRIWKFQIPYFSRHFRVVTFDPRGNGRSDRPRDVHAYDRRQVAYDAVAVLDAAGVERAAVVSWCGGSEEVILAAEFPDRVSALVAIAPNLLLTPDLEQQAGFSFDDVLDTDEGWAKSNRHYWLRDWPGYVEFFFSRVFTEPHSTKQIEDSVGWGLETDPETILRGLDGNWENDPERARALCARVQCPTLVLQGSEDAIVGSQRGAAVAAAIPNARLVTLEGCGHGAAGPRPGEVQRARPRVHLRAAAARPVGPAAVREPSARCSSRRRSGSATYAATPRSPTSCGRCTLDCRSSGWRNIRSLPYYRPAASGSTR